jgi:hypothetical protein
LLKSLLSDSASGIATDLNIFLSEQHIKSLAYYNRLEAFKTPETKSSTLAFQLSAVMSCTFHDRSLSSPF